MSQPFSHFLISCDATSRQSIAPAIWANVPSGVGSFNSLPARTMKLKMDISRMIVFIPFIASD